MSSSDTLYHLEDGEIKHLAMLAIDAKEKAYCPYSNFRVGAALILDTGVYATGSNIEVASTPVGICAERCVVAPVVASMKRPAMPIIRAIAVSTDIDPPASPCGMCRQMIREFCEPEMPIFMYGSKGIEVVTVKTIGELLPMSFGPKDLTRNPHRQTTTADERLA